MCLIHTMYECIYISISFIRETFFGSITLSFRAVISKGTTQCQLWDTLHIVVLIVTKCNKYDGGTEVSDLHCLQYGWAIPSSVWDGNRKSWMMCLARLCQLHITLCRTQVQITSFQLSRTICWLFHVSLAGLSQGLVFRGYAISSALSLKLGN